MIYKNVVKGEFISRPNRFIAKVKIDGEIETVHVKNTGRCRELLVPSAEVFLSLGDNPSRKTKYDLIAVVKKMGVESLFINMDSQIPNSVAFEWLPKSKLFSPEAKFSKEVTFGSSRFDVFVDDGDRKAFIEIKGVTLENDGIAMFPDAPTERGVKHIRELILAASEGYEAYLLFVIQMKGIRSFLPNEKMHPEFALALKDAQKNGVKIFAMDCIVDKDFIEIDEEVPVVI